VAAVTPEEYARYVGDLDAEANKVAGQKRKAYAGKGDVLKNFRRQAAFEGKTEYLIMQTFLNKQLTSVNNAIEANPSAPVDESEGMTSRLVDIINYCRLMYAKLREDGLAASGTEPSAATEPDPESQPGNPYTVSVPVVRSRSSTFGPRPSTSLGGTEGQTK
jgi:hypothetical protein